MHNNYTSPLLAEIYEALDCANLGDLRQSLSE